MQAWFLEVFSKCSFSAECSVSAFSVLAAARRYHLPHWAPFSEDRGLVWALRIPSAACWSLSPHGLAVQSHPGLALWQNTHLLVHGSNKNKIPAGVFREEGFVSFRGRCVPQMRTLQRECWGQSCRHPAARGETKVSSCINHPRVLTLNIHST